MKQNRTYHKRFLEYCDYIANHPNYKGLPGKFNEEGKVKWVVAGKSEIGKLREEWWMNQVNNNDDCNLKSDFARKNHPKELQGMKPCQTCGKEMSIHYVYPTENLKRSLLRKKIPVGNDEEFDIIYQRVKENKLDHIWYDIFPNLKENTIEEIYKSYRSKFSPGVMSNAPDRLDGFHSYNKCCRSKQDTGRSKENLKSYTQDRRSYEYWTDGNFNLVNRVMSEFNKFHGKVLCPRCSKYKNPSPDHIGPISLGFSNTIQNIQSMCKSCNSAKNNRMSYKDFIQLLKIDDDQGKVMSWHSKGLWNNLKHRVKNQSDVDKLSSILSHHLKTVLTIFNEISQLPGGNKVLIKKLNPKFSFYSYDFENFDPTNLESCNVIEKELDSKNKEKNSQRYIRISFESLKTMSEKDNRKNKIKFNKTVTEILNRDNNVEFSEDDLNDVLISLEQEFSLMW